MPGLQKEAVCNLFFRLFQGMKGEKNIFWSTWKAALSTQGAVNLGDSLPRERELGLPCAGSRKPWVRRCEVMELAAQGGSPGGCRSGASCCLPCSVGRGFSLRQALVWLGPAGEMARGWVSLKPQLRSSLLHTQPEKLFSKKAKVVNWEVVSVPRV